ncbi:hypothetical protein NP233_g7306 [Leucocoprinus birnbaumii]|uniref:Uncharacterized protein n=1 Tax=Leucocoprinus birnbaumii TaxID=56174 RepID=A0AAD5VQE7_9AGAR|nr:hypothetical protein NP233_g7306 [Leucocoprinus birnbaumii]
MTRPEKISKRKAFNKALRARAAEEQTSFASVLQRTQDAQNKRSFRAMLNQPTHLVRPQRQNRMNIPHQQHEVSDREPEEYSCSAPDFVEPEPRKTAIIDFMAIAKPAKVKGIAKDFEVVGRIKDVIALDDVISEF